MLLLILILIPNSYLLCQLHRWRSQSTGRAMIDLVVLDSLLTYPELPQLSDMKPQPDVFLHSWGRVVLNSLWIWQEGLVACTFPYRLAFFLVRVPNLWKPQKGRTASIYFISNIDIRQAIQLFQPFNNDGFRSSRQSNHSVSKIDKVTSTIAMSYQICQQLSLSQSIMSRCRVDELTIKKSPDDLSRSEGNEQNSGKGGAAKR